MDIAALAIGLVVGFAFAWVIRGFGAGKEAREAAGQLERTFAALSADALHANRTAVVELAEQVLKREREQAQGDLQRRQQAIDATVKPVAETLEKLDGKLNSLERARVGAFATLEQQLKSLEKSESELRGETAQLARALRSPGSRGRWGEMHLRRVVELAGLQQRCDFTEQSVVSGEEGVIRPDMIVNLAGNRSIVVDAKAPLDAYLDAIEAEGEQARAERLQQHAKHVRGHVKTLGQKAYWDRLDSAPEFVLLFLPGDHFLAAALEHDPTLHDDAVRQRVHIVTPTTLIPLLLVVAHGWREQALTDNAREISALGADLHKRIADLAGHWAKVGKHLGTAVDSYNGAVGSLETRVLVTARKLRDLEAARHTSGEIDTPAHVERIPREIQAPEMSDAFELGMVL